VNPFRVRVIETVILLSRPGTAATTGRSNSASWPMSRRAS
jgi:hypothetical protein